MKRAMFAVIVAAFMVFTAVAQDHAAEKKSGEEAAQSWLALVDAGNYSQSWEQAAEPFKAAVSEEDWAKACSTVRNPIGKLVSRQLTSAEFATSLPGAPDGQYVVLQFKSEFANKKSATETVVPMLDKDGKWHVSGYFVK